MNKNIVICCDGTGNKFGIHNTNIVKISQLCVHDIAENSDKKQMVYYDPGVGSLELPSDSWFKRMKRYWGGYVFGIGLNKNINDAYAYLMEHYTVGDKVFLFGFSRGAFTVRALAGMLFRFGLLRGGSENLILYASEMYESYREDRKIDEKIAAEFKASFAQECKPHFMGVFDTVAAMGILNRKRIFYDSSLNPDIKYAYQALAIDEKREPFKPFLWVENKKTPDQTIEQVWFAGDHGNIGGGHPSSALSDIALKWMLEKALFAGIHLKTNYESFLSPNPLGEIYNFYNWIWGLAGVYQEGRFGEITRKIYNNASLHESVKIRMESMRDYRPKLPANYQIVS